MADLFHVQKHPVFDAGVFASHPELFDRFSEYTSRHLQERFRLARTALPQYETAVTWPLLLGPGLCAATHPGADNVFVETMVGFNDFVYDSDCLYASPEHRIFAISDPPGITDSARRLFTKLDRQLAGNTGDHLEALVNNLSRETDVADAATLAMIAFPRARAGDIRRATAFVAGDTLLFHGNLSTSGMVAIEGVPDFFGSPHVRLNAIDIPVSPGDFFVIASDGILSIRSQERRNSLEQELRAHIDGDPRQFALSAMRSCNRCFQERIYDRTITRFGGSDNVSLLLVIPEELPDAGTGGSFILGGEITRHGR